MDYLFKLSWMNLFYYHHEPMTIFCLMVFWVNTDTNYYTPLATVSKNFIIQNGTSYVQNQIHTRTYYFQLILADYYDLKWDFQIQRVWNQIHKHILFRIIFNLSKFGTHPNQKLSTSWTLQGEQTHHKHSCPQVSRL